MLAHFRDVRKMVKIGSGAEQPIEDAIPILEENYVVGN